MLQIQGDGKGSIHLNHQRIGKRSRRICFMSSPTANIHMNKEKSTWINELVAYAKTTIPKCLFNFPSAISNKFVTESCHWISDFSSPEDHPFDSTKFSHLKNGLPVLWRLWIWRLLKQTQIQTTRRGKLCAKHLSNQKNKLSKSHHA